MADRDIFLVCNNVEELGGVQRWAHHLAGLFASRGHRVTLVGITHAAHPHEYGADPPYAVRVLHDEWRAPAVRWRPASPLARLDVRARLRDRRRTAAMRQGAARLTELLGGARPGGIVIAAQVWAMEWVRLAGTSGLKVIGMTHESYAAARRSSRHARGKEFFAAADRLLALTAEDADAWARDGMTNADHMPNPLHVTPGLRPTLRDPVVVSVGRLSFEKGVDMGLEAWAEVTAKHPDWRLRLYGSGPDEAGLRALADRLGISGTVEFRGPTSDVEGALAQASIFALPSRQEGFPMSLLEAMACGLPTVAFDCAPGVRELLTDETDGLLVNPGNTTRFAAALNLLIEDADLRRKLGYTASQSVRRFDPAVVADRWERLFDLLNRPGDYRE